MSAAIKLIDQTLQTWRKLLLLNTSSNFLLQPEGKIIVDTKTRQLHTPTEKHFHTHYTYTHSRFIHNSTQTKSIKKVAIQNEKQSPPEILKVRKHSEIKIGNLDTKEYLEKTTAICSILCLDSHEVAAPFLKFKMTRLLHMSSLWKTEAKDESALKPYENRLEYLAAKLECSKADVAIMMGRVTYLTNKPFKKIQLILETLLDAGISRDAIIDDPWIFIHNVDVMKERIKFLRQNGIAQIKPWVLRCPLQKYELHITRTVRENELKGGSEDIVNFLQTRLDWSLRQTSSVMPLLKHTTANSIEKIVTLLFSKGFTGQDIADCPRILRFNVETISTKLAILKKFSSNGETYPIANLRILCQSSKKFEKFIEILRNKNKVEDNTTNKKAEVQSDKNNKDLQSAE